MVMANHKALLLPSLIDREQSAFIPGKWIANNILLVHELVHAHQSKKGSPHRALKIDLKKIFDLVEWGFLRAMLITFGFPT